jgi:hypothetical protein
MEHRPLLRVAGPAWELARYFLFIAFLAVSSSSSANPDMLSTPWLLAACAGGLVMPAAFFMLAFSPARYAGFLPLLKLGKALEVATVVLLFVTGMVAPGSWVPGIDFRVPVLGSAPVAFGLVGLADLAVLAGLLLVRTGADTTVSP